MVNTTSLLQAAIVLFSSFLLISQLIIRELGPSDSRVGRLGTNTIIGALIALWYLLMKSILAISGLILQSNPNVTGLQAALEPMSEFVVLSGILFIQYIVHQTRESDSKQVWIDTAVRATIAMAVILMFNIVSVGGVF